MRLRTILFASALTAAFVQTGGAFAPHKGSSTPVTAAGNRQPRLHRTVDSSAPAALVAKLGSLASWQQVWDRDTEVPLRMWGPSIGYFGSTANGDVAENAARSFLAAHLDVLAPGSSTTDFVLAANRLDQDGQIRTVSFFQYARGIRVEGGSIAINFERDHLVMVSSTALPNIDVRVPATALAPAAIEASAQAFLASEKISSHVLGHGERVIVPMVFERGTRHTTDIAYRVAETVSVSADREAGRWDVWVDANDGAAIARKSTLMFLSGTVKFDVPDRYPGGTRTPQPAPNQNMMINAVSVQTDANGLAMFSGTSPGSVVPGLKGPYVAITNSGGALVTDTLALADGGSVTWSHASDPPTDAQLSAFVFASQAKQFVKTKLAPGLAWLGNQLSVTVNETGQGTCNAYSTGDDLHFFPKDAQCENTGRIADVVYHEFGHSIHANSFIPGEGQFDGSLSEGLADTMAVSITGDPGMGRGFFFTNAALRDVAPPPGSEKKWPQDADGEVHDEGEIIGESLYSLRTALEAKYGAQEGYTKFLHLYYGVLQRAADIPSSYSAVILADDNDGDLSNGVPDQCAINTAFAAHGLYSAAQVLQTATPPTRTGNKVSFTVPSAATSANAACPPPSVSNVTLTYQTRGAATSSDVVLTANGVVYSGEIPAQASGSVTLYHVVVTLADGSKASFPQNPADPDYQMFTGDVTVIKCFDFEAGLQGWTHGGARDDWEVGAPQGIGGDPFSAYAGTNVLGTDLSMDGLYSNSAASVATSPSIDLQGHTNVHLQYYRWLGVEDGAYDQATIKANGTTVWSNFTTPGTNPTAEVNHADREWGFHDVDLSAVVSAGTAGTPLALAFGVTSDQGLTLAGWNLDNVCIVAYDAANPALCGNGTIDPGETCDDGNVIDGDGCSATCQSDVTTMSTDGGCCSAGTKPSGAIALSLLTVGVVLRRRRRRATP